MPNSRRLDLVAEEPVVTLRDVLTDTLTRMGGDALDSGEVAAVLEALRSSDHTRLCPLSEVILAMNALGISPAGVLLSLATPIVQRKVPLGTIIKTLRLSKGYTQLELAQRANTTKAGINQYELGKRTPSFPVVVRIASALGVDVRILADAEFPSDDESTKST